MLRDAQTIIIQWDKCQHKDEDESDQEISKVEDGQKGQILVSGQNQQNLVTCGVRQTGVYNNSNISNLLTRLVGTLIKIEDSRNGACQGEKR